jgi:hypothetical protein
MIRASRQAQSQENEYAADPSNLCHKAIHYELPIKKNHSATDWIVREE